MSPPTVGVAATQPRWYQVEIPTDDPVPMARRNHTLVSINGKLYTFGGVAHGGNVLQDVWEFAASGALDWTQLNIQGQTPGRRHNHSAIVWRKKMYVFGGDSGSSLLNDIWEFDPVAATWKRVSTRGIAPKGRYGHACCRVGNIMYVHGGYAGAQLNDLWSFNLSSKTWSKITVKDGPRPSKRSFHRAITSGDEHSFFVLFGTSGRTPNNEVWEFVPSTLTWTLISKGEGKSPRPRQRSGHAAATNGYDIVIYGGTDGDRKEDLWVYSIANDVWTSVSPKFRNVHYPSGKEQFKPGVREGCAIAIVGTDMVLFGGIGTGALSTSFHHDVWVLDLKQFLVSGPRDPMSAPPRSYAGSESGSDRHHRLTPRGGGGSGGGAQQRSFASPSASDSGLSLDIESESPRRRKRGATLSIMRQHSSPEYRPPPSPSSPRGSPPVRRSSSRDVLSLPRQDRSPGPTSPIVSHAPRQRPIGGGGGGQQSGGQPTQMKALLQALEQRFAAVEKNRETAVNKLATRLDLVSRSLSRVKKDVSENKGPSPGDASDAGGHLATLEARITDLEDAASHGGPRRDSVDGDIVSQLTARLDKLEGIVEEQAAVIASYERQSHDSNARPGVTTSKWKQAVMARMNALESCITAQQEALVNLELLYEQSEVRARELAAASANTHHTRALPEGRPPKTPRA